MKQGDAPTTIFSVEDHTNRKVWKGYVATLTPGAPARPYPNVSVGHKSCPWTALYQVTAQYLDGSCGPAMQPEVRR